MIVFVTTRGHDYTFKSLRDRTFGFPAPEVGTACYDDLLAATEVARATYVFTDLERLTPFDQKIAAQFYRVLRLAGLRCLNDPARVMLRVELLKALRRADINPFDLWRADESPRPERFPVFLRFESDHGRPLSGLLADQPALDAALERLRAEGVPLRGVLVIEFCAAPYVDGLWHKWGTFCVGDEIVVDHIAVDDNWLVKYGVWDKLTDRVVSVEHDVVRTGTFTGDLRRVFALSAIEFGRADHAVVNGRTVIYEINTNPAIGHYVPDPKPLRYETQALARRRFGEALMKIDTAEGVQVKIDSTPALDEYRQAKRFRVELPAVP
jgi:hypothetical protein